MRLKKHLHPDWAPEEVERAHANAVEITAQLARSNAAIVQCERFEKKKMLKKKGNQGSLGTTGAPKDRVEAAREVQLKEEQIAHEKLRQESTRAVLEDER
ncbi:uncharacterized protein A4U43_C08F12380 [Asparagus officinalis]|nr:uncharacterized protein A4U43_C08F12380 [Asparagus officinalis]